jgi:hypothetical protein
METIYQIFIGSEASYAKPSRLDPPSLPYTDMLIGAAVLLGTVGCILIFRFLHRKWKNQQTSHTTSAVLPSEKKGFTQHQKQVLSQKIQETRISNLKKSFVGEVSPKGMIFATIGLIVIVLLWLLHAISQRFHPY